MTYAHGGQLIKVMLWERVGDGSWSDVWRKPRSRVGLASDSDRDFRRGWNRVVSSRVGASRGEVLVAQQREEREKEANVEAGYEKL